MPEQIEVRAPLQSKMAVELRYPNGYKRELLLPKAHPVYATSMSLGFPSGSPYFACVAVWGDPILRPPPVEGFVEFAVVILPPAVTFVRQGFITPTWHEFPLPPEPDNVCTCDDCRRAFGRR